MVSSPAPVFFPAAALTAYRRVKDRFHELNAGFKTHVAKPADPGELVAVIKSPIGRPNSGEKT